MKSTVLRVACVVTLALGCASVSPRFSQEVSDAFAHEPMRKLETASVELYYPAAHEKQAHRVLDRLEQCFQLLRKLPRTQVPRSRALVYLTSADFNNASVSVPWLGQPQQMLLPTHMSQEDFNLSMGQGITGIGDISCHEAVHYVQFQQLDGFWGAVNTVFGDASSTQHFLERWFAEGLAVYYEGRLGKRTGRPFNPLWQAFFESGVASRHGRLNPGDLNVNARDPLPGSGAYLVGSQFIAYLVRTYGEEKLWELIDTQGRSIFAPLWVSLRYLAVYGRTLDTLFEDFSRELEKTAVLRPRPQGQSVIDRDVGFSARLTSSPSDGVLAAITQRRDREPQLEVREPDGRLRFARALTQILPGRAFVTFGPSSASGLSFTGDGKSLFFVLADKAMNGAAETRLIQVDAQRGDVVRTWSGFTAIGGEVARDGNSYVMVEIENDQPNLARLDLRTGQRAKLTHFDDLISMGGPAVSPDGKRIAFVRMMEGGFDLFVLAADGQIERLTADEVFDAAPRWIDEDRLLFVREDRGHSQAAVFHFSTKAVQVITQAPYAVMDPVVTAGGQRVAFLNREAWSWTLDTAPLVEPTVPAEAVAAVVAKPALAPSAASVLRDQPYPWADSMFLPTLRVPWIVPSAVYTPADPSTGAPELLVYGVFANLSLQGSDRLGLHNWAINGSYDSAQRAPNVSAGYGTSVLAPWWLQVAGTYASQQLPLIVGTSVERQYLESRTLSFAAHRTFWTTPVTFSFTGSARTQGATSATPASQLTVVGPTISTTYSAADGTLYGGARTGIALTGSASAYPSALGSSVNMADVSAGLVFMVPLPFTALHTLRMSVRGRALPNSPAALLRVGGVLPGIPPVIPGMESPLSLPDLAFIEPLRGYEDQPFFGTRTAIAGARYRYTVPIDSGFASVLYLLPSWFIRQLEIEAFATAAVLNDGLGLHPAVGVAITLRTFLLGVIRFHPMYQYSYRFGAFPPGHFFAFSAD